MASNNAIDNTAKNDFLVTTSTAGTDRKLTISNTDNTATASSAHLQISVGGTTSTGDPYINFNVPGGSTFSLGIDNTDDQLKVTTGASPSAGTASVQIAPTFVTTLLELYCGRSAKGNSQGYFCSTFQNAAKWSSGTWQEPHITAFDEGQGTASSSIMFSSRTDNGGMRNFAFINVPSTTGGTLYLATGYGATGILDAISSVDQAGNWTLGAAITNTLRLNNATQATVGAAGGASGLPATPSGYLNININGSPYVIPYYAAS